MTHQDMAVKVTDSTESVLDVLHKGRATPGYIVEETDLSRQTVHSQLNQLLAGGHVRYVHEATGLYELIDDPRLEDQEHYLEELKRNIRAAVEAIEEEDFDDLRRNVRAASEVIEDVEDRR